METFLQCVAVIDEACWNLETSDILICKTPKKRMLFLHVSEYILYI